jgi:hypothetical protein
MMMMTRIRNRNTWMAALLALVSASAVFGQWRRNDDPYYGGGRGRGGYGGYGRSDDGRYYNNGPGILSRVRSDLSNLRSLRYADGHERNHYRHAMEALDKFERKFREGKWDRGQLDKAIENVSHLADARQIHPNDRYILQRDVNALREFRSRGAYGYRDNGNRPYWP